MIKVTLKDAKTIEYEEGIKIEQIVASIGRRLQKDALVAKVNGKVLDK